MPGNYADYQPKSKSIRYEHQSANAYVHRTTMANLAAATTNTIKNAQTSSNVAITTVTTFLAQPDFPRNLIITPGGVTNDIKLCDITVTGTDIRDQVITELFHFTENTVSAATGNRAFKTITSVSIPIQDGAGATFSIGISTKIGLDRRIVEDSVLYVTQDGAYEGTRPTVAYDAPEISKNTVIPLTSANGALDFAITFVTTELY